VLDERRAVLAIVVILEEELPVAALSQWADSDTVPIKKRPHHGDGLSVLDSAHAAPHLSDMFSVEVSYRTHSGELQSERINIPCASTCDDAQRIVREWLAARSSVLLNPVLASVFEHDELVSSLSFDGTAQVS
jgi:hypothetical protein